MSMQTRGTVMFGNYMWRVLDTKDDAMLCITQYIIEQRPYHEVYTDITWAECSLRKYLNGEFLDRFTETERARIVPIEHRSPDNEWYGTNGGANTRDSVFLLSVEEVACHYFGDSSVLLYNPKKNKRYWFERKDPNNGKRATRLESQNHGNWWWLRSPGRVGVKAVYVHGDGNIGIQGSNIKIGNLADGKCLGGVRPALWVKLGDKS